MLTGVHSLIAAGDLVIDLFWGHHGVEEKAHARGYSARKLSLKVVE